MSVKDKKFPPKYRRLNLFCNMLDWFQVSDLFCHLQNICCFPNNLYWQGFVYIRNVNLKSIKFFSKCKYIICIAFETVQMTFSDR